MGIAEPELPKTYTVILHRLVGDSDIFQGCLSVSCGADQIDFRTNKNRLVRSNLRYIVIEEE